MNVRALVTGLLLACSTVAAAQYSLKIGGAQFTVYCNTEDNTAEIKDLKYRIDDREYPLYKKERKIPEFRFVSGNRTLEIPPQIVVGATTYTITTIGKAAFAGYCNIDYVIIPNTVTRIDDFAFFRTSIVGIEIPSSVTYIGNRAFGYCENLKSITMPKNVLVGDRLYAESKDCQVTYKGASDGYAGNLASKKVISPIKKMKQSDVDTDIPNNPATNKNTFAIIIANENYQTEAAVEYALHDGRVFKEYCGKVLGLPEENIRYRENATLNNIIEAIDWVNKVAAAYDGQARFIFYYAGHCVPDEVTGTSFLLPVDGSGKNVKTGYSLPDLYQQLGSLPAQNITVFMDACFSGTLRGNGMLAAARGVAIKAKTEVPKGQMVVFSAAQGDETAYPYEDMGHGMFTYFLLKKLKETNGKVSLNELGMYVQQQVKRKSIISNGKLQTPTVSSSVSMGEKWKTIRLR